MGKYILFEIRGILLSFLLLLSTATVLAQSQITVKFSVDVSLLTAANNFSLANDRILIRGSFNGWNEQTQMNREGTTTIYSTTLSLNQNSFYDYKFFITTSGAANGGWESSPGIGNSGNRTLNTGTRQLALPVVFFDNGDLVLNLTTSHFNFFCTSQDIVTLPDFSNKLETEYERIVNGLKAAITEKVNVFIYKNVDHYHNAMGYPEFPEWATGSAVGKTSILLASPNHAGTTTYADMLKNIVHEFTHITESWKATGTLPVWLNEGVALWFAGQNPARTDITTRINSLGRLPELSRFEDTNTFSNVGGYQFAYTIAECIVKTKGLDKLADLVGNLSYPAMGFATKAAFQTAWHEFLNGYYVNTPPPAISIGGIRRFGNNWFINYSPHAGTGTDGNTLTYYITITGEGFSKTYADTNHTGSFSVPRADLTENTTYTVTGKSYDGIVYIDGTNSKTFTTSNIAPDPFTFLSPAEGQTLSYDSNHQYRIRWSPVQEIDSDGDAVKDKITVTGNNLDMRHEIPGANGYFLIDSADLKPGKTYLLSGVRTDGTDSIQASSVTFIAPGTDAVPSLAILEEFTLSPVPSRDIVTLTAHFFQPVTVDIDIYQITGSHIEHHRADCLGEFSRDLNISGYPQGTYLLKMTVCKASGYQEIFTKKLVRE